MKNISIIYLDHQVYSGLARGSTQYLNLKETLEKVINFSGIHFPYSSVHIQELAEIGLDSGMSKEERFELAKPILEYIKHLSETIYIDHNKDSTGFVLGTRDPFEFFDTFTGVELKDARIKFMIELIPTKMLQEIQSYFSVGPKELNSLSEKDAIERIDKGVKSFIKKCKTDSVFWKSHIAASKEQARIIVESSTSYAESALNNSIAIAKSGLKEDGLRPEEIEAINEIIENQVIQRRELLRNLPAKIKEAQDACESAGLGHFDSFTFEEMLDQISTNETTAEMSTSLLRTTLLDFFGYNAKTKNRSSDFYDALHREFAPACRYFVTDDQRFQKKLGGINKLVKSTTCKVVDSAGLKSLLDDALENMDE